MKQNAQAQAQIVIHLKDAEQGGTDIEELNQVLERRCERLSSEFPEIGHVELRVTATGNEPKEYECHGHTTGKGVDFAASAEAVDARAAADRTIDKLTRELRRKHDKRIFQQRRSAQRSTLRRRAVN